MGYPSNHTPDKASAVFEIEPGIVKTGLLLCADDERVIELVDITITVVDGDLDPGSGGDPTLLLGDNMPRPDLCSIVYHAPTIVPKGTCASWRNGDFTVDQTWRRNGEAGAPVILRDGDCLYWYFDGVTTASTGKVCISVHYQYVNARTNKKRA